MPLFSYFAIVGLALLSLIYFAENLLGPPRQLVISTNFYGLTKPFKASKSAEVLTVREAPAPEAAAYENALAQAPSAVVPRKTVASTGKKTKKLAKVPRLSSKRHAHTLHDNVTKIW